MLAVLVNTLTVLLGSTIGLLFRSRINEKCTNALITALGLITLVLGISSAIQTQNFICLIVCLVLGTLCGTLLRLEHAIGSAGDIIKARLFRGKGGGRFTEGFVAACIMFCVGSMTIMGSFEAGIRHDYTIIFTKSALDLVSSMALSAAMGTGVAFAALFVLVFQGALTLLAGAVSPYLSPEVVTEMSAVGGTILVGMGLNMLELSPKKISCADMLPGVFLPIAYMLLADLFR